ncbi:TIGR04206 family protein [Halogranum rubrum]|uniref:TIGR04206 family protein n=1 Tax=Halogranum rubrum TaxID=553466 RepID=A0A1I4EMK2_9EURY|nr:TIGR04206 family protein [Halogranum rubrum]SFL05381.1 TIGR04206 family protein [Halogranum rubrum]
MTDTGSTPEHVADSTETSRLRSRRRRLLAVSLLAFVPWSVQQFTGGDVTFVFAWGLLNTNPTNVTTLLDFLVRYTQGLPDYILAWPVGVGCYLVAVASAVVGAVTRHGDDRVTVAALVLAGLTQVELARGFSVQPGRVAWPLGTVALWAVAGYVYWSLDGAGDADDAHK